VQLGFPVFTIHREGVVASDAASSSDGQGIAQARFVKECTLPVVTASEDFERCLAHERAMRCDMVTLVEPGEEAGVEVVQ
jgi:hypothetical protein